jgi:6-phosphofructokinase
MARKNAFYAQSGGVSAVINASACGVLQTARQHSEEIGKVYAGRNGIIGALTEDLIDMGAGTAYPIVCVGIPKIVDNDLLVTDCSPGFGSVAKYLATSIWVAIHRARWH